MLGYRCYYDNKVKRYKYNNKVSEYKKGSDLEWFCSSIDKAKESVNKHNNTLRKTELDLARDMNKLSHLVLNCKCCGKLYTVYQSEYDWYKDHQYNIPKKCRKCRTSKKAKSS